MAEPVILRPAIPAITLDDALLSMSTFPNGCDFRLLKDGDRWFLEYGCYGVHVNLASGANRALMEWLDAGGETRELVGVAPETIHALLSRKPCQECGGTVYRVLPLTGAAP